VNDIIESTQLTSEQVSWLKKYNIKYTVSSGGLVDVAGDVDISSEQLKSIQVNFGQVGGDFYCYDNQLTSLTGAPREVGGNFSCSGNRFEAEPDHSFIKIAGTFNWR
jgi:hypothetical protein